MKKSALVFDKTGIGMKMTVLFKEISALLFVKTPVPDFNYQYDETIL